MNFVRVAGHFLGNQSIIEIMQESGFEVQHVKPHQPLPRWVWRKTTRCSQSGCGAEYVTLHQPYGLGDYGEDWFTYWTSERTCDSRGNRGGEGGKKEILGSLVYMWFRGGVRRVNLWWGWGYTGIQCTRDSVCVCGGGVGICWIRGDFKGVGVRISYLENWLHVISGGGGGLMPNSSEEGDVQIFTGEGWVS